MPLSTLPWVSCLMSLFCCANDSQIHTSSPHLSSELQTLGYPKGTSDLEPPKLIFSRKPASTSHLFLCSSSRWMASSAASSQESRRYLRFLPLLHAQLWISFPRKQTLRLMCKWFGGRGVPSETAPVRAEGGRIGGGS